MNEIFKTLASIDVSKHVEKKKVSGIELSYLSWAWAWHEIQKAYPDANYVIVKHNGLPYCYDEKTGYMVYTQVTIEGVTREMWLPVMDDHNRAMKNEPYRVTTKTNSFTVNAATMFDVNKSIMRCLVKNLAMFGLGLSIYAGEDLPLQRDEETIETKRDEQTNSPKQAEVKSVNTKERLIFLNIEKEIEEVNSMSELGVLYKKYPQYWDVVEFSQMFTKRKNELNAKQ